MNIKKDKIKNEVTENLTIVNLPLTVSMKRALEPREKCEYKSERPRPWAANIKLKVFETFFFFFLYIFLAG